MVEPTIKFCEGIQMNQYVTKYINEFGNTISALFFSFIAFSFFFNSDSKKYIKMYPTIILTFFVGIGSALFHATGSRFYQYFDEIPMILLLCEVISKIQEEIYLKKNYNIWLYKIIIFFNEIIKLSAITSNFLSNNFEIFKSLYMFLIFSTSISILIAIDKKYNDLVFFTIFEGFMGYFCWLIDYNFCNIQTGIINFHFWWHIFMGMVTSNMIELSIIIINTRLINQIIIKQKHGFIKTTILKNNNYNKN